MFRVEKLLIFATGDNWNKYNTSHHNQIFGAVYGMPGRSQQPQALYARRVPGEYIWPIFQSVHTVHDRYELCIRVTAYTV